MKRFLLILTLISLFFPALAQEEKTYPVRGRVTATADGEPLIGASVIIKGTTTGTVTDKEGRFALTLPEGETILDVSFIGFTGREIKVSPPLEWPLSIALEEDIFSLGEVQVVSTGYQQLPKARATGSFVQLDNELLNRRVSTGILERLRGAVPGLILDPGGDEGFNSVSIRGYSTLFANPDPLIVLDNFPFDGDINNINPNDVESITVLKDAAAASIWGARAGNGVIVITTKKGTYNQGPQVSFNSNVTLGESPDPFYRPKMSVEDYISTEKALFESGFYSYDETAYDNRAISPLVELLIAQRDGKLSAGEVQSRIDALRQQDVRRDLDKYFYRPTFNQQYALSVRGGSDKQRYYLSLGYDHNRKGLEGKNHQRLTLNARNTWSFFDKKLQFNSGFHLSQNKDRNDGIDPEVMRLSQYNLLPSYTRLADEAGYPLAIIQDYRASFVKAAEAMGFLDWAYRPIEENGLLEKRSIRSGYRVNAGLLYQATKTLSANLRYQYWNGRISGKDYYPLESYYTRDLINRFTQVNEDGSINRPVPIGGILDRTENASTSHNLRAQVNFDHAWRSMHEVSAIAGFEIKTLNTESGNARYYGYDDDFVKSGSVNFATLYPMSNNIYSRRRIPANDAQGYFVDRFVSWYANASYTYRHRYTLSASGRKDQSNLFGVEANQRGVPLWSVGLAWNIGEESFYSWGWLPFLKLRATFGYNGNIDKKVSAFTTAQFEGNAFSTGLPYARIINPPNPELRWERVAMQNIALDFSSKDQRLKGSIEYYAKQGHDLIGYAPLVPSTGQTSFRGNTAETAGHGMDITLTSLNIDSDFQWQTDLSYSTVGIEVTEYKEEETSISYLLSYGYQGVSPQEGRPLYVLYSYPWAGLDPTTGNPQGYLNGEISQDYREIIDRATVDSLTYHGSVHPTTFGAFRNTFRWKGFSLSVGITYRFGYYFRRQSIQYGYDQGLGGHGDYALRWQKPGDEVFTQIPSAPGATDYDRDEFYQFSGALIERGDNIRLQDIRLAYTLNMEKLSHLPFKGFQVYAYAHNLGILWKATDKLPDPDFRKTQPLASFALGINLNF